PVRIADAITAGVEDQPKPIRVDCVENFDGVIRCNDKVVVVLYGHHHAVLSAVIDARADIPKHPVQYLFATKTLRRLVTGKNPDYRRAEFLRRLDPRPDQRNTLLAF